VRRILIPFHKAQLPYARVAAEAALRGGAGEVVALAADEVAPPFGSFVEGVRVLLASDIGIDEERVAITAASYGTPGTLTSIVAEAVDALTTGDDATIVLAPTAHVVAPLQSIWDALQDHSLVLVPTVLDPCYSVVPERRMGLERRAPLAPTEIVGSRWIGAISSAVIGLRPAHGRAALDGWPGRMGEISHYDAIETERFEAWLDGLAIITEAHVLHDPGVGVAWFNLHERHLTRDEGGILLADRRPVSMLDMRGHDPRRPNVLSPGVSIGFASEHPALIPQLQSYSATLAAAGANMAHGATALAEHLHQQGRWATLPNGDQMVLTMRRLYRTMVADGELTKSPFTPEGHSEMLAAFREPAPRGKPAGVNRFIWSLWIDRQELRDAYPRLEGSDGPGLIGWVWAYGRRDELLPDSVMPDTAARFARGDLGHPDPALAPPKSRMSAHHGGGVDGVNLAGFFSAQLGLGESARLLVRALRARDIPVVPVQGRLLPSGRGAAEFAYVTPDHAEHPVSILMLNGDSIPEFAAEVGADFFRDRYTIGFYWWEVDPYPADAWDPGLKYVDELWAGTEFVGDILRKGVDIPVTVVRVPVAEPPPVTVDRAHFGLPDDATLFAFIYDYESSGQRKNPLGLVQAYTKAFGPNDGCHLLLKSLGHIHRPADHEEVLVAASGRPDITIIDRFLTAEEKDSLVGLCDCYVSPHRSEGFGYTVAEAMAYGKPVVCTAYAGVLDFANEQTARLVKWAPAITGPFAIPYPPDSRWADPDPEDLARQMRWVYEHPEEAAEMGRRAAAAIKQTHSYAASGASLEQRLEEIYKGIDHRNRTGKTPVPAASRGHRRALQTASQAPLVGPMLMRVRRRWWGLMDRVVASRTESLRQQTTELELALAAADRRIDRVHQSVDGSRQSRVDQENRLRALESAAEATVVRIRNHEEAHAPVPFGVAESGMTIVEQDKLGRVLHQRFNSEVDLDYGAFLDRFRGDWDRVRDLAAPYVPMLADHAPVLDLGCGRGELLDLLREDGIEARGIDLAPELVALARERGLEVDEGDAVTAIGRLAARSLGAITALHLIEHLDYKALEELLTGCRRALRPGGLLILETVNVYDVKNLAGFWIDPTHHRPIIPETLLALTGAAGFAEGSVFAPGGSGDWELDRSTQPRYAVVARKAPRRLTPET
jgi:glycosyltransferase involved in cell wall biosynthesis/2-polyprenyl-3-methyl-5-hydroxy-6-metoxy-1,4-benzoquinol methylase